MSSSGVATTVRDGILAANDAYAAGFTKGDLPMPPARRFTVVTCMDARLDPAKYLGLEEGDAHVIRNAGGLASDDAIRSLIISNRLLGTQEFFIIAHTDCGMLTFTNDAVHKKVKDETGADVSDIDFLPFPDLDQAVRDSVARVQNTACLEGIPVSGWVYDVTTGKIREVT